MAAAGGEAWRTELEGVDVWTARGSKRHSGSPTVDKQNERNQPEEKQRRGEAKRVNGTLS